MSNDNRFLDDDDDIRFDPSLAGDIDQESVETYDDIYPTIQWVNATAKSVAKGEKSMEGWGGWFMPERGNTPDEADLLAHGWAKEIFAPESGDVQGIPGYYKRDLTMIVVDFRERWQVTIPGEAQPRMFGYNRKNKSAKWDTFEKARAHGAPAGRLQVLVYLKGFETFGPFSLTLGGNVAMAFHSDRGAESLLAHFSRTVLDAAYERSKQDARERGSNEVAKRWPARAFYLTVGPARDASGVAQRTEVGKQGNTSWVTLPVALGLPDKKEEIDLDKWYVGNRMFRTATELYNEVQSGWSHAWDTLSPTVTVGAAAAKPAGARGLTSEEIENSQY